MWHQEAVYSVTNLLHRKCPPPGAVPHQWPSGAQSAAQQVERDGGRRDGVLAHLLTHCSLSQVPRRSVRQTFAQIRALTHK